MSGMNKSMTKRRVRRRAAVIISVVLALFVLCAVVYVGTYYHADEAAAESLVSGGNVRIEETAYGWLFDGPSDDRAMVFYPGGKVEETAYAPLLRRLAESGMDVCLVKMPVRLAILNTDAAGDVMEAEDYRNWYIGGHSLGGVCASKFAAEHPDDIKGLVMLASYPMEEIDSGIETLMIYGSEDGVLNMEKYKEARQKAPVDASEYVIEGGNHAQFGSYGNQKGDGEAEITAGEQMEQTVDLILLHMN